METLSRDVLPSGVHRRLGRRDLRLPTILMGELMAGMALGLVWPQLTAAPLPVPQTAMTAVTVPLSVPASPPVSLPTAVPVVTHAPRNPFGTPAGVDASQQRTVVPPPAQPAGPVTPSQPDLGGAPVPVYPPAPAAPAPVPAPPAGGPSLDPADLVYN